MLDGADRPEADLVAHFGLTPRQAQVARLMAAGLTNPQIAHALAISRFTARNHAEQVLAKLGVSGRGRVAEALRGPGGRGRDRAQQASST
jgi:DNA-binding CsgD family transcriptional regulator